MAASRKGGIPGIAVDSRGGPTIDPTANVIALTEAANQRQDDLRAAAKELSDAKIEHQKEISDLRSEHQKEIRKLDRVHQEKIAKAESGRLDSIRQVDREDVSKTATAANTAITTLAKQTTDLATTLQKQVSDTTAATEARNSTQNTDTNKRLSALELSSSEGKGKQTIADPQMEKLTALVASLAANQATSTGKTEGISTAWAVMLAVAGLIATLITIGSAGVAVFALMNRSSAAAPQPQVVYLPSAPVAAPQGATTTTTSTGTAKTTSP